MSSYARAYVWITYEKQKENSLENITWPEMGKQNVQAKEVYLTIRPVALAGYGSIAHKAKPKINGQLTCGPWGRRV